MNTDIDTDLTEVIKHFGNQAKIAKAIGITRQAVSKWNVRGIPTDMTLKLCELSGGKIKPSQIKPKLFEKFN